MAPGKRFWAVVLVFAAANGAYTGLALSLPVHAEWMFYVDLQIPDNVSVANGADDVAARLEAAGYTVSRQTEFGRTVLAASLPADPDYQARFEGLGEARARVYVDVRCRVAYLRNDCPVRTELLLREHLANALQASALPLDAREAHFGDYDFADWGEFWLFIFHLILGFFSIVGVILAAATARESKRPQNLNPPWQ